MERMDDKAAGYLTRQNRPLMTGSIMDGARIISYNFNEG